MITPPPEGIWHFILGAVSKFDNPGSPDISGCLSPAPEMADARAQATRRHLPPEL
jgi:hypothetical protein